MTTLFQIFVIHILTCYARACKLVVLSIFTETLSTSKFFQLVTKTFCHNILDHAPCHRACIKKPHATFESGKEAKI